MENQKVTVASDANQITRSYIDSILVEERLIDADIPSLNMELFGKKFATPIMMPAFSHLNAFIKEQEDAMSAYARAAHNQNMVNWIGMGPDEEFERIMKISPDTIRIIKPYADRDSIYQQIDFAEQCGAMAVGIDIDHSFNEHGAYDVVMGDTMAPLTSADLRKLVDSTRLPFVIKGVLSVKDAVKCAENGVQAIVVSHHHGRMPFAVPPLMVLPQIVREVGGQGRMKIFVDCGINTGVDAFKALALGADAVSVGRAIMPSLMKEGTEGAESYIKKMNEVLASMMCCTGCRTIGDLDPSVLWLPEKHGFSDNQQESCRIAF